IIGCLWVRLAGVSGALAVALGAYGAHVVAESKTLSPKLKDVFERANKYHLLHSLALLAVPLTAHPSLSGSLLFIGMTVFCGTCYAHVFSGGNKAVIRFTPMGGLTLIMGWLSMAYA
ncbi:unnamed protein product, partial [Oppiella nova]